MQHNAIGSGVLDSVTQEINNKLICIDYVFSVSSVESLSLDVLLVCSDSGPGRRKLQTLVKIVLWPREGGLVEDHSLDAESLDATIFTYCIGYHQ